VAPGRFDRVSVVLYLAMGWSGMLAYEPSKGRRIGRLSSARRGTRMSGVLTRNYAKNPGGRIRCVHIRELPNRRPGHRPDGVLAKAGFPTGDDRRYPHAVKYSNDRILTLRRKPHRHVLCRTHNATGAASRIAHMATGTAAYDPQTITMLLSSPRRATWRGRG
jgi:hypothetical protein